jgi:hypothetical protein
MLIMNNCLELNILFQLLQESNVYNSLKREIASVFRISKSFVSVLKRFYMKNV